MMKHKSTLCAALSLLLCISLLSGCSLPFLKHTSEPDSGTVTPESAAEPTAVPTPEPTPTPTPEPTPEPTPAYDLNFQVAGQQISAGVETLDLSQASAEEVDRLIAVLPALPALRSLELGSAAAESPAISWRQVAALREGLPNADIHYDFTIQGYPVSLSV